MMRFLLALLLVALSFSSPAAEYNATPTYCTSVRSSGPLCASTASDACTRSANWLASYHSMTAVGTVTGTDCFMDVSPGDSRDEQSNILLEYKCPAGGTVNGNKCMDAPECQPGYDRRADGTCIKDCTGKLGQSPPSPSYEFPNGGVKQVGGCEVDCDSTVTGGNGGSGPDRVVIPQYIVGKNCKYTGRSYPDGVGAEGVGFKPEPVKPKSPKDCLAAGLGYVQSSSGGTSCLDPGKAPPDNKPKVEEKKKSETSTPGPDGKTNPNAPDYQKKETTSSSSGGKTTTTEKTTTNPDEGGNCPSDTTKVDGKCVKTKVTTESDADFCTKNPKAESCKAPPSDECIENPDRVGCMDQGEAPEEGVVDSKSVGVSSITISSLASSNGCPSGPTLPKGLGVYNWEPMCDFAGALKPIVLAFAWLAAGLIVIGSIRD